jgi:segregation and condensation protein A
LDDCIESKEYLIEYNKFRGPISLLLEMVQKKKENIYEISLSDIIKDFVNYIKTNKDILIDTLSGFIYIASILIEIKSRSLIPSKRKTSGEEEDELKTDILKSREEEYKVFKKISNYFRSLYEKESLYYIREAPLEEKFLKIFPDFTGDISLDKIIETASKLIKYSEEKIKLEDYYNHSSNISIFDEMNRIREMLHEKENITFREISSSYKKVIEKIISFLSILELYKKGVIDIIQFENFGSIVIKRLK